MAHKQTRPRSHADFRHRSPLPLPAVEDVEQGLLERRSPSLRAPRQLARRDPRHPPRLSRMRQRLLTLPVIVVGFPYDDLNLYPYGFLAHHL